MSVFSRITNLFRRSKTAPALRGRVGLDLGYALKISQGKSFIKITDDSELKGASTGLYSGVLGLMLMTSVDPFRNSGNSFLQRLQLGLMGSIDSESRVGAIPNLGVKLSEGFEVLFGVNLSTFLSKAVDQDEITGKVVDILALGTNPTGVSENRNHAIRFLFEGSYKAKLNVGTLDKKEFIDHLKKKLNNARSVEDLVLGWKNNPQVVQLSQQAGGTAGALTDFFEMTKEQAETLLTYDSSLSFHQRNAQNANQAVAADNANLPQKVLIEKDSAPSDPSSLNFPEAQFTEDFHQLKLLGDNFSSKNLISSLASDTSTFKYESVKNPIWKDVRDTVKAYVKDESSSKDRSSQLALLKIQDLLSTKGIVERIAD